MVVGVQTHIAQTEQLGGPIDMCVRVHHTFGATGAARAVKPKSRILRIASVGGQFLRHGVHRCLEVGIARRRRARGKQQRWKIRRLTNSVDARQQVQPHNQCLGSAVAHVIGVVRGQQKSVERQRNRANFHGAQKQRHKIQAVWDDKHHPVSGLDAVGAQHVPDLAGTAIHIAKAVGHIRAHQIRPRSLCGRHAQFHQVVHHIAGQARGLC